MFIPVWGIIVGGLVFETIGVIIGYLMRKYGL